METVEVVIKLPQKVYLDVKNGYASNIQREKVIEQVKNGIVLPKGHGDLIDRKALMDNGYQMEPVEMWYGIKYAPTIIEAEKSEEKDNG